MHHGQKVEELLEYTQMDKTELAKKLDATRQTVYNLIKRKRIKSVMIDRLAKVFNVPVSYFESDETIDELRETFEGTYGIATAREAKLKLKGALDQIKLMKQLIEEKDRIILDKEELIQAKDNIIHQLEQRLK